MALGRAAHFHPGYLISSLSLGHHGRIDIKRITLTECEYKLLIHADIFAILDQQPIKHPNFIKIVQYVGKHYLDKSSLLPLASNILIQLGKDLAVPTDYIEYLEPYKKERIAKREN